MGFVLRWVFAFLLVSLTYNPTQYNYVEWAVLNYKSETPLAVLMGLLLVISYIVYLRATLRSIGPFGVILILSVVGATLWVLYDKDMLSMSNKDLNTWIGVFALSTVLGIGLSWSIVRRMLTGQADVDDLDQ